jgi:hypothetical protein
MAVVRAGEKKRINVKVSQLDDRVYVSLFIVHNQIPNLIVYKLNGNNDTISGDGDSANLQKSYEVNSASVKKVSSKMLVQGLIIHRC